MDSITIRDLRVETRLGVSDEERATLQTVVVNVEIGADLSAARASDDIADTIDYSYVTKAIADLVRSSETRLLESLADKIARRIVAIDGAARVTVEVVKPSAPLDEDVGSVSVKVER